MNIVGLLPDLNMAENKEGIIISGKMSRMQPNPNAHEKPLGITSEHMIKSIEKLRRLEED